MGHAGMRPVIDWWSIIRPVVYLGLKESKKKTMQVPFVDFARAAPRLRSRRSSRPSARAARGDFIMGGAVERFEAEYTACIGARHAIGVGTGLAGDRAGAPRLERRPRATRVIAAGDTFIATVLAPMAVGATPVFVDADTATCGIDAGGDQAPPSPRAPRQSCRCTSTASRSISTAVMARARRGNEDGDSGAAARRALPGPARQQHRPCRRVQLLSVRRTSAPSVTAASSRPATTRPRASCGCCTTTASA